MPEIKVLHINEGDDDVFAVEIAEGDSTAHCEVTVTDNSFRKFAPDRSSKKDLVRESFEFLLEREPKESILSSFEIGVIEKYFPEYPEQIVKRLE